MPAVIGDIFGLGDVYIRQVSPVTVGVDTSGNFITESGWSDLRSHGWFGGGEIIGPSLTSIVDRIDFSNDLIRPVNRGPLSSARQELTATGNSNYGWFGGGAVPSLISTINRINFSNDSPTASVRNNLLSFNFALSSVGNSNYGWFGGGADGSFALSRVDRIDFFNDTSSLSQRGSLSQPRYYLTATGNSNFGWFGGGYNNAPNTVFSTIDRIDFANDSSNASFRSTLSTNILRATATGNSNYGWFAGGFSSPTGMVSRVERIDFANDSASIVARGPLIASAYSMAATGNSNYGWFGGGAVAPAPSIQNRVQRIDFANDSTTAANRAGNIIRRRHAATSGQAKTSSIRLQKAGNFGWFGGGSSPSLALSSVDRIDFSNDSSTASPRGPLILTRYKLTATGNSNYGWFGGGYFQPPPTIVSTVDRIDFSNDSAAASVRGPLSQSSQTLSATGNSNYGWFGGGVVTSVDRIDFSNDSSTASPRGKLSQVRYAPPSTSNSNYGWFGGGSPSSSVDRIDFSNDSATASLRGPLSSVKYYMGATGNSNYGWFGGGNPKVSTVDRIDFSNDSAAASVRGPLSSVKYLMGATANSNYGWFGGGQNFINPSTIGRSTVDRIDFSNDSVQASPRGNLSLERSYLGATSNTPIG